jgi:phytanoyl-CoA hydroxylase
MDHDLDTHGAVIMSGILTRNQAAEVQHAICAALAGDTSDSGVTVFHADRLPAALLQLVVTGPLARAVRAAIGPCEFLSLKPVVKDAERSFATPWHQDRPYWGGCAKWSLWLALDDVGPAEGCLRIVPGSHHQTAEHQPHDGTGRGFAHRLSEPDPSRVRDVPLRAGDAVLFHDLLWHASHAVAPGRRRIALIPTYRPLGAADSSTVWNRAIPVEAA